MRRITITLDDEIYVRLIDYAADRSKDRMSRFSLAEAVRELLASQFGMKSRKVQFLVHPGA